MAFQCKFIKNSHLMMADECKTVQGSLLGNEINELDLIEAFYNRMIAHKPDQPNYLFLDVGANTGSYAFIPSVDKRVHCLALEPNIVAFDILMKNIALNKSTTKAFNIGLWRTAATIKELKIPVSQQYSGIANLADDPTRFYMSDIREYTTQEVACTTLDAFVEERGLTTLDAIKIDTEGSEKFILQGGKDTLTKFKPMLLLEFDNKNTTQFGYSREELKTILAGYGYTWFPLFGESDIFAYEYK